MPKTIEDLEAVPAQLESTLERILNESSTVRATAKALVSDGFDHIFVIGSGGALVAQAMAERLLAQYLDVSVTAMNGAELVARQPRTVRERALVIAISDSGTGKHTIEGAAWARRQGARVVAVTRSADTPLAKAADITFTQACDEVIIEALCLRLTQFAYALLEASGVGPSPEEVDEALAQVPALFREVPAQWDGRALSLAQQLSQEPITYVLGTGPNTLVAYLTAMCYLQECQWLHAASFNGAEFFHGAFEVVTRDVPVIVLIGEDSTREHAERAARFVREHTDKAWIFDARELDVPAVPSHFAAAQSWFALLAFTGRLLVAVSAVTGHDHHARRYMGKGNY